MTTGDKQERIRVRAYELWVQAGRPHGDHLQHWDQASAEIEAQDRAAPAQSAAQGTAAQTAHPAPRQTSGAGPALAEHSKDAVKPTPDAAGKARGKPKAPARPRKPSTKPV